ncbi:MAG: ABC transporter permease [Candidatus Hodarchaeales archaeon]
MFLVAVIAGATVSYTSGLSTKEFFLGEAGDIFVITGQGSTPVTSLVPEYLIHNLELVPGVIATSPEVLAIGYINNRQDQLAIIRGVDPDIFLAIESPRIIDGVWFSSISGGGHSGALVGKSLASLLHLSPGDEIIISSTLTDVSLVTVITGIIETGTPIDDEIILPRAPVKMLSNAGPDSTTLIRVVFNSSITNRIEMAHLVNSQFDVPIKITIPGAGPSDPFADSILVKVFSYTGELITSKITGVNTSESFSLPFGLYYFEVLSTVSLSSLMAALMNPFSCI